MDSEQREEIQLLMNDTDRLANIVNDAVNNTDIIDRTVGEIIEDGNPEEFLAKSEAMAYGKEARSAVSGISMKERRALQAKTKASMARQIAERDRNNKQTIEIYASKKYRYKSKSPEFLDEFSERVIDMEKDDIIYQIIIYHNPKLIKKNKLVNRLFNLVNTDDEKRTVSGNVFIAKEIDGELVDMTHDDIPNFFTVFKR